MAYNREKTLAIVTGIVCGLIFLAGTVLGSYHAIITIGVFAGGLATACYLIGDIAIAWAAYIDYEEDGNAMEWAAWAVKYGLSFYLLFSGGCIAYMLFTDGGTQNSRTATMKRASEAQAACVKNAGAKPSNSALAACRRIYETTLQTESAADQAKETERVKWVDDFTGFPLFNYIPGIAGLASLLLLTFVSKLTKGSAQSGGGNDPLQFNLGGVRMQSGGGRSRANFTLPVGETESLQRVSNGQQSFRFKPQGGRYAVNWRSNGRERYGVMVTPDKARSLAGLSYDDVARFVIDHRRTNDPDDGLSREIQASV